MGLFDRFSKRKIAKTVQQTSNPYPQFDQLIAQSMEELRLKTAAHDSSWQLGTADWAVDQTAGTVTFTSPKGIEATCDVQIIATRNDEDGSLVWGWGHPSIPDALQQHAEKVRQYGEQHGYQWLTTQMISCPEDRAWELTSLACKLNEAQGAYRGPSGPTAVFMTFDNVMLTKAGDA